MRNLYCPLSNDKLVDLTSISWIEKVNESYAIELSNGKRKVITKEDYECLISEDIKRHKVITLPVAGLLIAIIGGITGLIGYNAQEEPIDLALEVQQCLAQLQDNNN